MKHNYFSAAFIGTLLALTFATSKQAEAQTIWNGPVTNYNQPDTDPTVPANQDRLTDNVWLTRAGSAGLFNAVIESSYSHNFSPADTEWAFGTLDNYANLSYTDWEDWNGRNPPGMVGRSAVVHLITDDIYLSLVFTRWDKNGGTFAYTRSTPAAASPPTVSINSPTNGTVLAAPARIALTANATVSGGTVTNVAFFTNNLAAGSAPVAPFSLTLSNLAAGNYSLTAVATAAGVSSTSNPVNITVVTPVAIQVSAAKITNGQFAFDYSANPGLSYVIQSSSNLVQWTPVTTNVAAGNPAHFNTAYTTNHALFYRVGRLPNP